MVVLVPRQCKAPALPYPRGHHGSRAGRPWLSAVGTVELSSRPAAFAGTWQVPARCSGDLRCDWDGGLLPRAGRVQPQLCCSAGWPWASALPSLSPRWPVSRLHVGHGGVSGPAVVEQPPACPLSPAIPHWRGRRVGVEGDCPELSAGLRGETCALGRWPRGRPDPLVETLSPTVFQGAPHLGSTQCGLFATRGRQRATQLGWGAQSSSILLVRKLRFREAMRCPEVTQQVDMARIGTRKHLWGQECMWGL